MDDLRLRALAARDGDAVHEAILGDLKAAWTSLPGIIKVDSDGHIAIAISAIKMPVVQVDGTIKMVEFPDFEMSPVHYPGGGGVSHTHPVKKGDEGVVQFLSRAQDLWHKNGGVQDPVDSRAHHLADSRWYPGGRSDPRKLNPKPSTTSQQNRSDNGNHVSDVHPDNGITHSSTVKHLVNVGGTSENGSGTVHLPNSGKILKNAKKVLINSMEHPQLPPPGNSFANKKLIATKPIGAIGEKSSVISAIMSQVMTGGISTLLQNPLAAAGASMQASITAGAGAVGAILGGGGAGLVSALMGAGGLSSALSSLVSGAGVLSGADPTPLGAFGLSDVLGHAANLTQYFGTDAPPAVAALSAVLGPLQSSTLQAAEVSLSTTLANVMQGRITIGNALSAVNQMISDFNAIVPAANNAITALNTALPSLALATLAGSVGISLDANERAVAAKIASPSLTALTDAMAHIFTLSAEDAAAISSFPDSSAAQAGARGAL